MNFSGQYELTKSKTLHDKTGSSSLNKYFQTKIALYDSNLTNVLSITFNATNAGTNEWMTRERLIDSPYTNVTSAQWFSIPGYV